MALLSACWGHASGGGEDACGNALRKVSCTALAAPRCEGQSRDIAERILDEQCAAFDNTSTWGQRLCQLGSWIGVCRPARPLSEAIAVSSLDAVCPRDRLDSLCDRLRAAAVAPSAATYEQARALIARRIRDEPRPQVLRDAAVRWFVRERALALFVWNVVTRLGADAVEPADYAGRAQEILDEYFPSYDHGAFAMAHTWFPPKPSSTACQQREGLVVFPGVVRVLARNEFEQQLGALHAALPCLETALVNSNTFVEPAFNAARGRDAITDLDGRIGNAPLHVIGYSQGSLNALWLLSTDPQVASRVQTVLTFNSAAHGSEVADHIVPFVDALSTPADACSAPDPALKPLCAVADQLTTAPSDFVLGATACAMGLPEIDLQRYLAAENVPPATLREFLLSRRSGLHSLTTTEAQRFWQEHGSALPLHTLYLSARSIVRDPRRDLPASNCLTYQLLNRSDESDPYNDMQVRLANQRLGGPVADVEVIGPVAEGNHWQWKLVASDLPELVMPREMIDRLPAQELFVAHFEALHDVGLLLRGDLPE
jgi:pimeloyl-ACP methyl ester carboxylesterase